MDRPDGRNFVVDPRTNMVYYFARAPSGTGFRLRQEPINPGTPDRSIPLGVNVADPSGLVYQDATLYWTDAQEGTLNSLYLGPGEKPKVLLVDRVVPRDLTLSGKLL